MCGDNQTVNEMQAIKKELFEEVGRSLAFYMNNGGDDQPWDPSVPRTFNLVLTNQTQELPEPLPPYPYRGVHHSLESIPAMAELLLRLGSAENSIVYFNDNNVNAVLDRTVQGRSFDLAKYVFEASPQASDWAKAFNHPIKQKEFIKFLKSREPGEVPDTEALIVAAQKITANFKIIAESTHIDSNNHGIVYKVEDSTGKTIDEGMMNVPTKLEVTMPLLKESQEMFTVDIEVELVKPVDGQPPYFTLSCHRWTTFWRQAVEKSVDDLRGRLPGYLIMAGKGFSCNS